jgi:hypothetical protein
VLAPPEIRKAIIQVRRLPKFLEPEINDALSPIYPFDIRRISDGRTLVGIGRWRQ